MSSGHGYKFTTARTTSPGGTAEPMGYYAPAPNSCTHVGWTDERVEQLRELVKRGLSASQAAKALGGITRNAVIGKVNRMGIGPIGGGKAATPAGARRPRPAAPARSYIKASPAENKLNTAVANAEAKVAPAADYLARARVFQPLPGCAPVGFASGGCRWPCGGEGASMVQCGCEVDGAGPYCGSHAAVAYQPLPKTKRSPAAELARGLRRYV